MNLLAARPGIGAGFVYPVELLGAIHDIDSPHHFVLFVTKSNARYFPSGGRFQQVILRPPSVVALRYAFEQLVLPVVCRLWRVDLLHCTGNISPRFTRRPTIVTLHFVNTLDSDERLPGKSVRILNSELKRSASTADRVIVVSRSMERDVWRLLKVDRRRTRVVPLGLSSLFFAEVPVSECQSPEFDVLIVTNSLPHKNNQAALEAIGQVSRTLGRRIAVKMVGIRRPQESLMQQVSSLRDEVDLELIASLAPGELRDLFRRARIYFMPSTAESFCLPALEAMACACPVVASSLPALIDLCGEAAEYCDPFDGRSMEAAILRGLIGQDRERRAQIGMAIAAGYTWRATAQLTMSVYGELVG